MRIDSSLLLRATAAWLLLTDLGHSYGHVVTFVTRSSLSEERQAAYELMKQPVDGGWLETSFWGVLQMLSLELSFFLAFAAIVTFWIAARPEKSLRRQFAGIGTSVFGLASVAFAFVHPQIHALVIAAGATLLYGLAWTAQRARSGIEPTVIEVAGPTQ